MERTELVDKLIEHLGDVEGFDQTPGLDQELHVLTQFASRLERVRIPEGYVGGYTWIQRGRKVRT